MKQKITLLIMMLIASAGFIQAQILEDFETASTVNAGAWGGYEGSLVKNPDTNGNPSDTVWKIKKKWSQWDGSWVNLPSVDYTAGKGLAIKVWSTKAGTSLMAKVEHGTGGAQEVAASTTAAMAWETLNYDFSEIGTGYTSVVFYLNGGTEKDLPDSIMVDDIELVDFAQSPKATISSLKYDGTDVQGFHQTIFSYDVLLAQGTVDVPVVTATAVHPNASVVVNDASGLPGTTTVVITAENGVSSITYSINFTVASSPQEPQTAAPTPPDRTPAEVISIFSDAYTDVEGTNFNPYWWQSTVQTFDTIEGDAFMKFASFNWQGADFGSDVNASSMEFLHVDMWTANASSVNVFCNSRSTDEKSVSLPITQGEWVSYDIPLTDFSSQGLALNDLYQYKFDGGDGTVTIFLDNIYFYRVVAAGTDATLSDLKVDGVTIKDFNPNTIDYLYGMVAGTTKVPTVTYTTSDASATAVLTDASAVPGTTEIVVTSADGNVTETYSVEFKFTRPAAGAPTPPAREPERVISIFSDAYDNIAGINWNPSWGQSTKISKWAIAPGDTVMEYNDLNWQGTLWSSPIDASGMDYIHIDMWTNNADSISLSPLSGAGEARIGMSIKLVEWVAYDIPVASFPSPINPADLTGIKIDSEKGEIKIADIILDNIYFYSVVKSEDADLKSLSYNDTPVPGFDPGVQTYTVELPQGTVDVPTVTATPNDDKATVDVSNATSMPGTTFITVTAEEPSVTKTYSIDFTLATSVRNNGIAYLHAYAHDGILHISCPIEMVNGTVEVFDITGKKIFSDEISSSINAYTLNSKGVMIIKVADPENRNVVTRKVISSQGF